MENKTTKFIIGGVCVAAGIGLLIWLLKRNQSNKRDLSKIAPVIAVPNNMSNNSTFFLGDEWDLCKIDSVFADNGNVVTIQIDGSVQDDSWRYGSLPYHFPEKIFAVRYTDGQPTGAFWVDGSQIGANGYGKGVLSYTFPIHKG